MSDDITEHQSLIRQIEGEPRKFPRDDIAQQIMERIEQNEKSTFFALNQKINYLFHDAFIRPLTKEDCAASFIVLGFFYLVVAILLLFFMRDISATAGIYKWLKFQTSIFILVAVWLALVGAVVWAKGNKAARFAHIGSFIYILIFAIGGFIVSTGGKTELLFAAILSLGALITALSLDGAVKRLQQDVNHGG